MFAAECARAFVGSDETVSIVKIVSLSPCVKKPKLKEGNKSFVPEVRESSVFRVCFGFLCVWTFYEDYERFMNTCTFHISVSWLCYKYTDCISTEGQELLINVLIWWWGSSNARALGNAEYTFIAIVSRSIQARSERISLSPIYGSNRMVWHLNCMQRNDLC